MSILQDFKKFALRGNVIDMAVGVIVGGAFGKIVSSLVDDLIMPPLGVLTGDVDFSRLAIVLKQAVGQNPAVAIRYGLFINTVVNFLIIAVAIFLLVQLIKLLEKRQETQKEPSPVPTREEVLLTEIRDILKSESAGFRK